MASSDDEDDGFDTEGFVEEMPREPHGPSLNCPQCDVHGRTRADYGTWGDRKTHDLNEFVNVYCKKCGTKLGTYKLISTEDVPPVLHEDGDE